MNLKQEVNGAEVSIALQSNTLASESITHKSVKNYKDPVHILHFSENNTSDRLIFDLISCQYNLNWHFCQSHTLEEFSTRVSQGKIDLILIHQSVVQIDELNFIDSVAKQASIPIVVIVDEESEAIASLVLSIDVQDYITLEEMQDYKILQRTIYHTINFYQWKLINNSLMQTVATEKNIYKQSKTLNYSEERFHLLSENVPLGIFQLDHLGNPIYTNAYLKNLCFSNIESAPRKNWIEDLHPEDRVYLEQIGALDTEEKLDRSWMQSIHPDDRQETLQSFEKFIQNSKPFCCEFRLIRSRLDIRWILGQGNALRGSNGEVIGYIGTITDITDRKQAEEHLKQLNIELENRVFERTAELQQTNLKLRIGNKIREFHEAERQKAEGNLHIANDRLQAVLDAVPGSIAWVSSDLTYLGVNQLMADTFQIERSEFIGKNVDFIKFKTQEYVDFVKDFFTVSDDNISKEFLLNFGEDKNKFYLLIGQKYSQGQAAVFVTIEITEIKQAEIETQNALEKIKELSELKSRFIFMVSHEFRTPLTSIFSASELLEHYGHKWSPEKKLQYLQQIQESVQRMNGLLEDVLIIGAGEVGKLKLQPTELDIIDFCQNLIEEIQLSRKNRHILNFTHNIQLRQITIDAKLLRHILSNLLSNSIKYSPKEMPVHFDLCFDNDKIIFKITDHGIGIPIEDQKHLFDLFHRASNVGTIGGTGIGLSIVKKSVDALGGDISFQSEIDAGSNFTVSIPTKQLKGDYQW